MRKQKDVGSSAILTHLKSQNNALHQLSFNMYGGCFDGTRVKEINHVQYTISSAGKLTEVIYADDYENDDKCYRLSERNELAKITQIFMRLLIRKLESTCTLDNTFAKYHDYRKVNECSGLDIYQPVHDDCAFFENADSFELLWSLRLLFKNGYVSSHEFYEDMELEAIVLRDALSGFYKFGGDYIKWSDELASGDTVE